MDGSDIWLFLLYTEDWSVSWSVAGSEVSVFFSAISGLLLIRPVFLECLFSQIEVSIMAAVQKLSNSTLAFFTFYIWLFHV